MRWKFEEYNCISDLCTTTWWNGANPTPPCGTVEQCGNLLLTACEGAGCTGFPCFNNYKKQAFSTIFRYTWECT